MATENDTRPKRSRWDCQTTTMRRPKEDGREKTTVKARHSSSLPHNRSSANTSSTKNPFLLPSSSRRYPVTSVGQGSSDVQSLSSPDPCPSFSFALPSSSSPPLPQNPQSPSTRTAHSPTPFTLNLSHQMLPPSIPPTSQPKSIPSSSKSSFQLRPN